VRPLLIIAGLLAFCQALEDNQATIEGRSEASSWVQEDHVLCTNQKWPVRGSQKSRSASSSLSTSSYGDSRYLWGLVDSSRTWFTSDALEEISSEILVIMKIIAMGRKHKVRIILCGIYGYLLKN
jgi:hypothetical protein